MVCTGKVVKATCAFFADWFEDNRGVELLLGVEKRIGGGVAAVTSTPALS